MTRMEALLLLTTKAETEPEELPCEPQVRHREEVPLHLAALASLSGMLDDAESWDQLCEAIEHARSLFSCGVLGMDAWDKEIREIAKATLEHDEQDAELN